jgi:hypothetical protein
VCFSEVRETLSGLENAASCESVAPVPKTAVPIQPKPPTLTLPLKGGGDQIGFPDG